MANMRHDAIMDAADAYARAVAYQRDDYRSARPQRDALEAEVQALADQLRGAVEALRRIDDLRDQWGDDWEAIGRAAWREAHDHATGGR